MADQSLRSSTCYGGSQTPIHPWKSDCASRLSSSDHHFRPPVHSVCVSKFVLELVVQVLAASSAGRGALAGGRQHPPTHRCSRRYHMNREGDQTQLLSPSGYGEDLLIWHVLVLARVSSNLTGSFLFWFSRDGSTDGDRPQRAWTRQNLHGMFSALHYVPRFWARSY